MITAEAASRQGHPFPTDVRTKKGLGRIASLGATTVTTRPRSDSNAQAIDLRSEEAAAAAPEGPRASAAKPTTKTEADSGGDCGQHILDAKVAAAAAKKKAEDSTLPDDCHRQRMATLQQCLDELDAAAAKAVMSAPAAEDVGIGIVLTRQGEEERQEAWTGAVTDDVVLNQVLRTSTEGRPGAWAWFPVRGPIGRIPSSHGIVGSGSTTLPVQAPTDRDLTPVANPVTDLEHSGHFPPAQEHNHATDNLMTIERKARTRRLLGIVLIGSGFLILVGVVVLAVALKQQSDNARAAVAAPASNITTDASDDTASPTLPPQDERVERLLHEFTLQSVAVDSTSPQAQAFSFVMNDPWLDGYSDWRIQQRFALATLCHATGGEDTWLHTTHWLSNSIHECLWHSQETFGVSDDMHNETSHCCIPQFSNPCEEADPHKNVTQGVCQNLWLWGNKLQGALPPELFMLSSLKSLSLASEQLGGAMPTLIGELTSLRAIAITRTVVTGTTPTEIGLLKNLTHLGLFFNQLSGTIPSELGALLGVTSAFLDFNVSNCLGVSLVGCSPFHSRMSLVGCFPFHSPQPIEFQPVQHSHSAWIAYQVI